MVLYDDQYKVLYDDCIGFFSISCFIVKRYLSVTLPQIHRPDFMEAKGKRKFIGKSGKSGPGKKKFKQSGGKAGVTS